MPPASRNQRPPPAGDPPAPTPAPPLARPAAIAAQNRRRFSRCATPGRPGDPGNTARSARSERRLPALIATPSVKGLRRPLESTFPRWIGIGGGPLGAVFQANSEPYIAGCEFVLLSPATPTATGLCLFA